MIFVIAEDNVLSVFNNESDLQGGCEGIDVEDGVYKFFDENGEPLIAQFYEPNQKGKIFGILGWVISGKYILVQGDNTLPKLQEVLSSVVGLENNSHFSKLEEVHGFLTNLSKGTTQSGAS